MPVLEHPDGTAFYVRGATADEVIEHGYEQFIPDDAEQAFERAFEHYEHVGTEEIMMDFGGAINAVKAGHKVQRDAWSLSQPGRHVKLKGIDSVVLVMGDSSEPKAYIAGPDDMLAEDWNFVRLPDTGDAKAGDPLAQRTYEGQEGPTIPQENIDNDNVQFVDTASVGPVPVGPTDADPAPSHADGQRGGPSPVRRGYEDDEHPAADRRVDGDGPA